MAAAAVPIKLREQIPGQDALCQLAFTASAQSFDCHSQLAVPTQKQPLFPCSLTGLFVTLYLVFV